MYHKIYIKRDKDYWSVAAYNFVGSLAKEDRQFS